MTDSRVCCRLLDDFLDRDLTAEQSDRFMAAARHCDACRSVLEQQQLVDRWIRQAWADVSPPRVSVAPANNQIQKRQSSRRWRQLVFVTTAALVAAVLLVGRWIIPGPEPSRNSNSTIAGGRPDQDSNAHESPQVESLDNPNRQHNATHVQIHGNAIGLPLVSDEEFTLVYVYPTHKSHQSDKEKSGVNQ